MRAKTRNYLRRWPPPTSNFLWKFTLVLLGLGGFSAVLGLLGWELGYGFGLLMVGGATVGALYASLGWWATHRYLNYLVAGFLEGPIDAHALRSIEELGPAVTELREAPKGIARQLGRLHLTHHKRVRLAALLVWYRRTGRLPTDHSDS